MICSVAQVVLLLGGNMGERERLLAKAEEWIVRTVGTVVRKSNIYESEPWGFSAPRNFLNRVVVVETTLLPMEVLDRVQDIEKKLGRIRRGKNETCDERIYESRLVDIDILFYDDLILNSERLIIPHPLIAQREFVLVPLREIMGEYVHPVLGKMIRDL